MFKNQNLNYSWSKLGGDLCGGAIAALIALPYGLALASAMGLPPVMGLFTSFLSAPVTAILGSNPVLIGGTASATVPFIAAAVKAQGLSGAAKISIVAAVFMLMFSVLRWGRYAAAIPLPVVSGFSSGIGAMMVLGQLKTIFGLNGFNPSNPIGQLIQLCTHLSEIRYEPLLLGLTAIICAAMATKLFPKSPGPLVGVFASLVVSNIFRFHERQVGLLPLEIPPLAGFSWTASDSLVIIPSAFGLAVVASVNILLTSRLVKNACSKQAAIDDDSDKELGAYGIANICAGMFGAPISVGIPARSLANLRCGGSTVISNIMHALFLVLFLGAGGAVLARLPVAGLAGITAFIGYCLFDIQAWRRLKQLSKLDAAAFIVTAVSILFVNAAAAVTLGCSLYFAKWMATKLSASQRFQNARLQFE